MKVIKNCWDVVSASECSFGAHLFENSTAKIYVAHGLDVGLEMSRLFYLKNEEGFVGHCILVFYGVKTFELAVNPYDIQDGKPVWRDPVVSCHRGLEVNETKKYSLGGGLYGFQAYVAVEIDAESFEIHILEESDCARNF